MVGILDPWAEVRKEPCCSRHWPAGILLNRDILLLLLPHYIFVKEHFQSMSSKAISEYSHEEKAYKETTLGQIISYNYADELSI